MVTNIRNNDEATKRLAALIPLPVDLLSNDDVKFLVKECWEDPVFFCKYFLPHLFPQRIPWLHRGTWAVLTGKTKFLERYGEVDKIVDNFTYERNGTHSVFERTDDGLVLKRQPYTLMIWPRGFSKTTLAGVAFNLYNVVFQELPMALYVSATGRHAEGQLENIKRELESNERIIKIFGELKPGRQEAERWRVDMFETTSGMTMVARGSGGQVRGLNHRGQRPKIVIVDDLEDRESVATAEQREKLRKWAYADLIPVLPKMDPDAAMVALGTLLHPDSLMMTWAADPRWTVIKFGARDKQGDLLWPENMDEEKLKLEEESAVVSNTLSEFYMERHSEIRLDKDRDFRTDQFQYKSPELGEVKFISLYQDPAISQKEQADRCTFTVVGMSDKGRLYVLDQVGRRGMSPREQIDTLFELWSKWKPHRVGIESNGYQAALIHLVQEEMFRKKSYFEVTPVTNTTKKFERIKGILQPRFAAKYVYFASRWPELENELLNFPMSKHDDFADGLAGAVSLLDDGAFLAQDGTEAEVVPLRDVIGGDWRHAV
jgi:predicted phage terminase large subunit-like protein